MESGDRERLGRWLTDRRIALGRTQQQVAADAGVSDTYISDLENANKANVRPETLHAIAQGGLLSDPVEAMAASGMIPAVDVSSVRLARRIAALTERDRRLIARMVQAMEEEKSD